MVKFLINRPVAVLTTFIALLLLGFVAARIIPISPLPNIEMPEIFVHVSKKNTSAKELEQTVVGYLRTQLQQLPGIENVHSESFDGYACISLRFKYGTDLNYAFLEANEKVDFSMNILPRDMERPRVVKSNVSELPVFYINLFYKQTNEPKDNRSFEQLCSFADQVVKRRFEQMPEIAMVDITGLSYPEIYIQPKPAVMRELRLNESALQNILEENNLQLGTIEVKDGFLQYQLRFASAKLLSAEDVSNIKFKVNERILSLADVADVSERKQTPKGRFIAEAEDAINLAVIMQQDARMETLKTKTDGLISYLQYEYPGIQFQQVRDQTALLSFSISNLKQDLLLGSCLAFSMLFLFFRNFRTPLLIGITVPVSLLLSLLFFYLFNMSINIISLSGMVLGVGLMIDNSIIVIDNITQKRMLGLSLNISCSKGTHEIIRPLLSSVLTTISVFVPLIFLSGISGALFYDQAMAITIGLFVSFIVAVTLLPVLYRLLYVRNITKKKASIRLSFGENMLHSFYHKGFDWVMKHQFITTLMVIAMVSANVFVFNKLKKEQLPRFKQSELIVDIDWNQHVHIDENTRRVRELIAVVQNDVKESDALVGEQQFLLNKDKDLAATQAQVYLHLKENGDTDSLKLKFIKTIEEKYPEAVVSAMPPKTIFEKVFGESEPDIVAQISPVNIPDAEVMKTISAISGKIRKHFPGAEVMKNAYQHSKNLYVDAEKLMQYGVKLQAVYNKLKTVLNVNQIGSIQSGQQFIPIVISGAEKNMAEIFNGTMIENDKGIEIPISYFASLSDDLFYKKVEGGKHGEYIPIAINNVTNAPALMDSISRWVYVEPQYQLSFSGNYFSQKKLVQEMMIVLLVSVALLYFILAAQFESLLQPLIVLLELPISLSAALIVLYLFGSSLNVMSMIGLITICGIIINDSILKIDTINQLRRQKKLPLIQAIHKGGQMRLNSIIMTSMTTILSVFPFLFGSDMGAVLQRPLSLSILGGMLIGTLVSLFFIPLVYYWCYRKTSKATY